MKQLIGVIILSCIYIIPLNVQSQQYCQLVKNSFGDILGSDTFYPADDTILFKNNLNRIIESYYKQCAKEKILYNLYLKKNLKDSTIQDTVYVPDPTPDFVIKQQKLIFIKQELHVKIERIDMNEFVNYIKSKYH